MAEKILDRPLPRLGAWRAVPPPVPALAPFGVAQCRECGCTGTHACPGGCSWVKPDLCSACAQGAH